LDGEGYFSSLFRGLSFTYPGKTTTTLHDVNFKVEPGEVVAIVGQWHLYRAFRSTDLQLGCNGSGKSTFLNVLLRPVSPLHPLRTIVTNSFHRLYDFGEGSFRINDTDVRRYAAEDLHSNTSAVFQEFSQFNATLRENVGVGKIEEMESDLAVKEALQAGGGARLLEVLPQGLDSVLDDGFGFTFGASPDRRSLSGGEVRNYCISPTPVTGLIRWNYSGKESQYHAHLCDHMLIYMCLTRRIVL
jgi:ABC-type multidrug transport system fused ATPase/permease subunit